MWSFEDRADGIRFNSGRRSNCEVDRQFVYFEGVDPKQRLKHERQPTGESISNIQRVGVNLIKLINCWFGSYL